MKSKASIFELIGKVTSGMHGNWWRTFATLLVLVLMIQGLSFLAHASAMIAPPQVSFILITTSFVVAVFLICSYGGPLAVGVTAYFLSVVRAEDPRFKQLFCGFDSFGKSCGVFWLTVLLCVLWGFPLGITWAGLVQTASIAPGAGMAGMDLVRFVSVLCAMALLVLFICFRHSLILFAFVDDPEKGVIAAVRRGIALVQRNYGKLYKAYFLLLGCILIWMVAHMLLVGALLILGGILGFIVAVILHISAVVLVNFLVQIYSMGFLAALYDDLSGGR